MLPGDDGGMTTSATQPTRRAAIDVARVGALVVVVAGHLLMAVVDRGPDGSVRGVNLFELEPAWRWITLCSPMPVFFAAGGWANASASPGAAARRLRPLVGLATVVAAVWYLPAVVELAARGERGVLGDGARLATQPIWFLAAYVPLAFGGGWLGRLSRRPVRSLGACLAVLALNDLLRFIGGAPEAVGWIGFLPAWAVPWLLGSWWRRSVSARVDARRFEITRGALVAGICVLCGTMLVGSAGYAPTLIDVVPGDRSNTSPPTLFTAVAAAGQVGVLMLAAGVLDRIGNRHRVAVARAATVAVPVYLWHLTGLALCSGVVALGVPVPGRLTVAWWSTRPVWWAAVLAVTGVLVSVTARAQAALRRCRPGGAPSSADLPTLWAGAALATVGAALVGLRGPASALLAVVTLALLGSGWRWLRT